VPENTRLRRPECRPARVLAAEAAGAAAEAAGQIAAAAVVAAGQIAAAAVVAAGQTARPRGLHFDAPRVSVESP